MSKLRQAAAAIGFTLWALVFVVVGFVQRFDAGPLLEDAIADATRKVGVVVPLQNVSVRFPGNATADVGDISWQVSRRSFRVQSPGTVEVRLHPLAALFGGTAVTASAWEGALEASATPGGSAEVVIDELPISIVEGPHSILVESDGALSGRISLTAPEWRPDDVELAAQLALNRPLDFPGLLGMMPPLAGLAVEAELTADGERATVRALQVTGDAGQLELNGSFGLRPNGSGELQAVIRPTSAFLAEHEDLAMLAQPYRVEDELRVAIRQERGRWSAGR